MIRKNCSSLCVPQWRIWFKDVYLGVPVKLGKNGVEEIIEIDLDKDEKKLLETSANSVKEVMKTLDDMKLF